MRISLLWSPDAGDGVPLAELEREIERAGHTLAHLLEPEHDLSTALDADLVVAAGGDGTVRRLASELVQREVPLAILPFGTANNFARHLGIEGSIAELVGRWRRSRPVAIDLGVARGAWGETRFLEAVGSGLVSSGIRAMQGAPHGEDESADARLARAVETFRAVLARLPLRPVRLRLDGAWVDGRFLLVEVLNIRSAGPNLVLAPDADPSDGYLTVVTAGEEHRQALDGYLEQLGRGAARGPSLPTRHARSVEIEGLEDLHVDDEIHTGPAVGAVSIGLLPGALRVLL